MAHSVKCAGLHGRLHEALLQLQGSRWTVNLGFGWEAHQSLATSVSANAKEAQAELCMKYAKCILTYTPVTKSACQQRACQQKAYTKVLSGQPTSSFFSAAISVHSSWNVRLVAVKRAFCCMLQVILLPSLLTI